jgi:hypothetical protein
MFIDIEGNVSGRSEKQPNRQISYNESVPLLVLAKYRYSSATETLCIQQAALKVTLWGHRKGVTDKYELETNRR